jgi:Flp pilus assembly protein TadG
VSHRRRRGRNGQSLVEFALVLPIFLFVLFGLIDAGRYVYMSSTLSQAAREGARLAAVEVGWIGSADASCNQVGGPVCPATITALQTDVTTAANRMVAPFGSIPSNKVYVFCDPTAQPTGAWTAASPPGTCAASHAKDLVSVRTIMTFTPVTPIASSLLGTVNLAGSATMVIN